MVVPLKSVPDSPLSLFIPVTNKQKLYMTNDFKQEWDIKLYMNNNSYKKNCSKIFSSESTILTYTIT